MKLKEKQYLKEFEKIENVFIAGKITEKEYLFHIEQLQQEVKENITI